MTIYTIGHSNIAIEDFMTLLRQHQIATLVDVRSMPQSRFSPQFNRARLRDALATRDIVYDFAGASLGGRPKDPTCYKTGTLPEGKADYPHMVDYGAVAQRPWFQHGIEHVIALAGERRTAIMCSEKDPLRCHRHHLIAKVLLARDIPVQHILHDPIGVTIDAADLLTDAALPSQRPQQGRLWE